MNVPVLNLVILTQVVWILMENIRTSSRSCRPFYQSIAIIPLALTFATLLHVFSCCRSWENFSFASWSGYYALSCSSPHNCSRIQHSHPSIRWTSGIHTSSGIRMRICWGKRTQLRDRNLRTRHPRWAWQGSGRTARTWVLAVYKCESFNNV